MSQRLWIVRGGQFGELEQEAISANVVGPAFIEVSDLGPATTKEAVATAVRSAYPHSGEGQIKNFTNQLNQFRNSISTGDLVVMPRKNTPYLAISEVMGDYDFRSDLPNILHTRPVKWLNTEVPRDAFKQDLLYSFGAFLTVCEVSRNNALDRVKAVLANGSDPGPILGVPAETEDEEPEAETAPRDLEELARQQIHQHIAANFAGHGMARLVDGVLQADGYVTRVSPPGKDGGVDILAGRGSLGLDEPRLCVQVKSGTSSSDVTVLRALQGTMQNVKADHGLLVSWGGVTQDLEREANSSYFAVRVWHASDLIDAILRNYDRLSEEIKNDLPLKRSWMLVLEE